MKLTPIHEIEEIIKNKGYDKYIKKLRYSKKKNKKYDVILNDDKIISFGAKNMSDFTIHKNSHRRDRFKKRFKTTYEKYGKNNPRSALFWSYNVLW